MNIIVERLEGRRLLSATPDQLSSDLQQTESDGLASLSDLAGCRFTIAADAKAVSREVRKLPHTAQERTLVKAFHKEQSQWLRTLMRDYHKLLSAGISSGRRAVKEGKILINDPSNSVAQAKMLSALQTLQQRGNPPLSALLADMSAVNSSLNASLTALTAANPSEIQLGYATGTEIYDANTCINTFPTDATTLRNDVAELISDLGG